MLSWIIGYLGVIIFTGLMAYHTQKILALNVLGNEAPTRIARKRLRAR